MLEFLNQSWFATLIGLFGLIVGIIGLILYRNSRIGPRPTCLMHTLKLIGKSEQALPPEVDINFQGKSVPRLALTEVYLWNAGKQMMRGDQIVGDDPLRCEFESNDRILKAHVAAVTRTVNKLTVSVPQTAEYKVIIDFDYLDPNDGARIELLHTSQLLYPQVLGSLRGIPNGIAQVTPTHKFLSILISKLHPGKELAYLFLILGLATLVLAFSPASWLSVISDLLVSPKKIPNGRLYELRLTFIIVGILYAILPSMILLAQRKKYPKKLTKEIEDKEKTKSMS